MRAITKSDWKRDSSVMMSSVMPSVKYSCSGSPLMFWNGSTAIDGLSGKRERYVAAAASAVVGAGAGAAVAFQSAGFPLDPKGAHRPLDVLQ